MSEDELNGWGQYQKLVITEMARLASAFEGLRLEVNNLRTDMALINYTKEKVETLEEGMSKLQNEIIILKMQLNFKSGIWGSLAGLITAIGSWLIWATYIYSGHIPPH